MDFCLGDRLFVALAKRVGFPDFDTLRRCRDLQLEWIESGSVASLFSVAQIEGVIDAEQAARFVAWGQKLSGRQNLQATREQPSPLAAPAPPPLAPLPDANQVREATEVVSALPPTRPPFYDFEALAEEDLLPDETEERASIGGGAGPLERVGSRDDLNADAEPVFMDDDPEPLFAEDDDAEPLFAEDDDEYVDDAADDDPARAFEDEDETGSLRLLPDEDDADMEVLRQRGARRWAPKVPRKPEVMDERHLNLIDEDEVSEVFEVKATWGDAERHTQSAADLGLEDDPLKGVFEALDAQIQKPSRRQRKRESRLGGLVEVFDESDDSGVLDRKGRKTYTEDEVLDILESEEHVRSKETQRSTWRDTWSEDRPSAETAPEGRRRSSRRLAASSGSGMRALRRRPTRAQAPKSSRRQNRF